MNGPYRAGNKNPHATVYRHTEHDPPEGTLVAVATGCARCGHGTTGQQLADALNAQHGDDDGQIYMIAQVAALLVGLPREERLRRIREAYDGVGLQASNGIVLTEELVERIVNEAEKGHDTSQIRPRGDAER